MVTNDRLLESGISEWMLDIMENNEIEIDERVLSDWDGWVCAFGYPKNYKYTRSLEEIDKIDLLDTLTQIDEFTYGLRTDNFYGLSRLCEKAGDIMKSLNNKEGRYKPAVEIEPDYDFKPDNIVVEPDYLADVDSDDEYY